MVSTESVSREDVFVLEADVPALAEERGFGLNMNWTSTEVSRNWRASAVILSAYRDLTQSSLRGLGAAIRRMLLSQSIGTSGFIHALNCCGGNSSSSCDKQFCQNIFIVSKNGNHCLHWQRFRKSGDGCGVSEKRRNRPILFYEGVFYLELTELSTGDVCFFADFCLEIQIHIDRTGDITV